MWILRQTRRLVPPCLRVRRENSPPDCFLIRLAGLVPYSRESGQWKGKSFGGKMIPRIIFCSALSYAFPWLPG